MPEKALLDYSHVLPAGSKLVTVVVVRPRCFEDYTRVWGRHHAILRLPSRIDYPGLSFTPTPEAGGIGYARLAIQLLADAWRLSLIHMWYVRCPFL